MFGKEAVTVAIDRSASAASKTYSFGTVWELGQKIALSWADEVQSIDFIPYSASFTVYPNVDHHGISQAILREQTGQSTHISALLRYCFNEYTMWTLSGRETPIRLVLVCDGEPDDIIQAELEIKRFILNRLSASYPFTLEIITQTPWPEMDTLFKAYSSGVFKGFFNTYLLRDNNDRPSYY